MKNSLALLFLVFGMTANADTIIIQQGPPKLVTVNCDCLVYGYPFEAPVQIQYYQDGYSIPDQIALEKCQQVHAGSYPAVTDAQCPSASDSNPSQ